MLHVVHPERDFARDAVARLKVLGHRGVTAARLAPQALVELDGLGGVRVVRILREAILGLSDLCCLLGRHRTNEEVIFVAFLL